MAQLTVRKLDDDLVQRLKVRAAHHGCSAEAEHRLILENALRQDQTDFWESAAEFRDATRRPAASDGTAMIREARDRDPIGYDP